VSHYLHTIQGSCLRNDSRREFFFFARSVGVKLLKFCSTATRSQCRRRKSHPPTPLDPPSSRIRIVLSGIKGDVRNVLQSSSWSRRLMINEQTEINAARPLSNLPLRPVPSYRSPGEGGRKAASSPPPPRLLLRLTADSAGQCSRVGRIVNAT